VIARKDGERVRLWARTTSDYSKAFTRIRDAVAALPVESAVLDGEAIVMRSADRCDFEALRSRGGQAEAILVPYDIMEVDGQDVRPERVQERLARLLSRSNKALRDGTQLKRGDQWRRRDDLPARVLDEPRRHCLQARRVALRKRPNARVVEDEEPEFRALRGGDGSLSTSRT
jgi:ATP-dependent DNA ligase